MSSRSDTPESAVVEQAEWWRNCSSAELMEIAGAGAAGGDRFLAAVHEIERRSEEGSNRAHSMEAEHRQRQARKDRLVRLSLTVAAVALAVLAVASL